MHAPWVAHGMRYVEILLLESFFFAGCFCKKYPNEQSTSTGNGRPISSTGTITGTEKSHFRFCVERSFSSFSGSVQSRKSLGKN